jgi:hypothetical protein
MCASHFHISLDASNRFKKSRQLRRLENLYNQRTIRWGRHIHLQAKNATPVGQIFNPGFNFRRNLAVLPIVTGERNLCQ